MTAEEFALFVRGSTPLPLTVAQAVAHAARLRRDHGMSYPNIAAVMAVYHGHRHNKATWRRWCRAAGAAPIARGFGHG